VATTQEAVQISAIVPTRAKNAGITLKSEPRDTEWKSRAFEVIDPSGFLLTVFSEASA
jgi:hypothetical protein